MQQQNEDLEIIFLVAIRRQGREELCTLRYMSRRCTALRAIHRGLARIEEP